MNSTESTEVKNTTDTDCQAEKAASNLHYEDYLIERTEKVPLRFKGICLESSGFDEMGSLKDEYGITVYQTAGGNYVAEISEAMGYGPLVRTRSAGSLEVLAKQLESDDSMRYDNYNEVVMYLCHQLLPDDPDYVETID